MKIFLTGRPGVGKSSVIIKLIEATKGKGVQISGFVTPEVRKKGKRVGFIARDISSGKEKWLSKTEKIEGAPRVSKYYVDVNGFEEIVDLSLKSVNVDLIIIDELGTMEFYSKKFKERLNEILKSDVNLVATLHRNYVKQFSGQGKLIEVTEKNRETLHEDILEMLFS